jgi:hypothetical protein
MCLDCDLEAQMAEEAKRMIHGLRWEQEWSIRPGI